MVLQHWRSQNVAWSNERHTFVPTRATLTGYNSDDVFILAKELEKKARTSYIAIGQENSDNVEEQHLVVFYFKKQRGHWNFRLEPSLSYLSFQSSDDEAETRRASLFPFFTNVFQQLNTIVNNETFGQNGSAHVRFWKKPYTKKENVRYILESARNAGFTYFSSDLDSNKRLLTDAIVESERRVARSSFVVWKMAERDRWVEVERAEVRQRQTPTLRYFEAKKNVDDFLLSKSIFEDPFEPFPANLTTDEEQDLKTKYRKWFLAMKRDLFTQMPDSLADMCMTLQENSPMDKEELISRMKFYKNIWAEFFMTFETKYPLLFSVVCLWRLNHLLYLV